MFYRHFIRTAMFLFLALSLILVTYPQLVYFLFSLSQNGAADLLAKRAGALFLGFGVLCFLAQRSLNWETKRIVLVSIGTAMCAMALLGIYELLRGNVGIGILFAIVTESAIAACCFICWKRITIAEE